MQQLFEEIVRRCEAGERVGLCTVVSARGSTPQAAGARMVLLVDGRTLGTLGGGCVEAEVRQRALGLLERSESKLLTFKLDHDYGWDDGLICGGTMDIYVQTLQGQAAAEPFADAVKQLRAGGPAVVEFSYETEERERSTYREEIEPSPKLVIAGAGHVGQALAKLATEVGFEVTIIDDRADLASAERFPTARHCTIGEIEPELRRQPIDASTFIVIVTRGHRHDGKALAAVIDSDAKYIGLIGSKRKVKTIFDDLLQQGVALESLLKVHAPIGLEIGSVTVPEIAVSIAAELVAVRRGRGGQAAKPLKFDAEALRRLLESGGGGGGVA